MKNLKIIIMLPLLILGSLSLTVIDLVLRAKGKPTLMEEWDDIYMGDIYMGDIMNHGQGRKE